MGNIAQVYRRKSVGWEGQRMIDNTWRVHPGRSAGSEGTNVAVEHQRHGNSRTEAALFNVNIDLFLKGNNSRFKSLSLSHVCSLTLVHWLALLLIYLFL